jgi:hypothetical protein
VHYRSSPPRSARLVYSAGAGNHCITARLPACQRQPGGEVRILPQPTFLPLLHPGGTRPPFHPIFLPWLKPCGGPPPPPGPFAEAIVPVETAKATDSATMAAVRGTDVRNFPSSSFGTHILVFNEVPACPKRSQHKHLSLAAHESKSFKFVQHKAIAMSALPPKADVCDANHPVCSGPIADICRYSSTLSARLT